MCVPERCMSRNDASSTGWMGGCRRAKGLAPRCHFASAMAKRNCTACSFRFPEKFISLTSSNFYKRRLTCNRQEHSERDFGTSQGLKPPEYFVYFKAFKPQDWGKRSAEGRRRFMKGFSRLGGFFMLKNKSKSFFEKYTVIFKKYLTTKILI